MGDGAGRSRPGGFLGELFRFTAQAEWLLALNAA